MKGVAEFRHKLDEIKRKERAATLVGMRKASQAIRRSVRKELSGPPRWGHRGRSRIYAESIELGFRNNPRGGGLGKFTGLYRKGVGYKKRPVLEPGTETYVGGVGIGGSHIPTNNFKKRYESIYPGFAPGVHKADAEVERAFFEAWRAAGF